MQNDADLSERVKEESKISLKEGQLRKIFFSTSKGRYGVPTDISSKIKFTKISPFLSVNKKNAYIQNALS